MTRNAYLTLAEQPSQTDHVRWLEDELRSTRDRLRTVTAVMGGANDELRSSNEELQAANAELGRRAGRRPLAKRSRRTGTTATRAEEDRRVLVFAEVQHRVKNVLAVVRSISARTVETSGSLEAYAAHFGGRLDAMARAQGVLARRGPGGIDLEDLVRDELTASAARDAERVEVSGPRIALKEKAVEAFSMMLHELTTNAVKYGALSVPNGSIVIRWRLLDSHPGRALSWAWQEYGVPALDPSPSGMGFGRDLIERGLPYDLGAATSLRFTPGGARCTVDMALDDRIWAADQIAPEG